MVFTLSFFGMIAEHDFAWMMAACGCQESTTRKGMALHMMGCKEIENLAGSTR